MEINVKTLFDWIMKGIVFIVVVTLLAGAGTFLYTKYFISPTYRAEVKFCADSEDPGSAGISYYKSVAPQYVELLNGFNQKLQEQVDEKTAHIVEMHNKLILGMATMVESRDNSTGGHIRRTSEGVRILTDEIRKDNKFQLSDEYTRNLIKAAPMHDLGKIAVDDQVLRKPGRFEPWEFEEMKKHAMEGARIVHAILQGTDDEAFHQVAENMAHYHHERWDGSGYPEGLSGENIPLEARIMAVADVYDALVSKRVYKDSMSFEKADSIIMSGMGTQFDPALEEYYVAARPRLEEYYRSQDDAAVVTKDAGVCGGSVAG